MSDSESPREPLPTEIDRLLAPLDERDREIMVLLFGLDDGKPQTVEEIGAKLDLTPEKVRQIVNCALTNMRHPGSDTGVEI